MSCRPFNQLDYLDLWRRVLPTEYTYPIETEGDGQGLDVPAMQAAIWARVEAAQNVSQQAYFLIPHSIQTGEPASGPRSATTILQVSRAAPTVGTVTLPAGTAFRAASQTSLGAVYELGEFLSTIAVTFDPGVSGPLPVPVRARFPGYTGNVRAGVIRAFVELGRSDVPITFIATDTAQDTPIPGIASDSLEAVMVGRYARFSAANPVLVSENAQELRLITGFSESGTIRQVVFDPPLGNVADVGALLTLEVEEYADFGFSVVQPNPAIGGVSDMLGAIAADRRLGRVVGESDYAFRLRILTLDDSISPGAMERICQRILGPYGICCRLIETREVQTLMGFTYDVHPWDLPGEPLAQYIKPPGSQLVGQGIAWVGPETAVRYFALGVERSNLGEFGFPYDATNPLPTAPNAWDVGFYDGYPITFYSLLAQLYLAIDQARAAGIRFDIFIDSSACAPIELTP